MLLSDEGKKDLQSHFVHYNRLLRMHLQDSWLMLGLKGDRRFSSPQSYLTHTHGNSADLVQALHSKQDRYFINGTIFNHL